VAEVDVVQVQGEDLVLAQVLLQPAGEDGLLDLALVGPRVVEQHVLDHLLGDGAAPLGGPPGPEVREQCPQHADVVEAPVLVEARVFRGQERQLGVVGQLGERDHRAALGEQVGEHGPVARQDPGHLRRRVPATQLLHAGHARS
jgi:hypothetical protein